MPKVRANNITMNYDQKGTGEPLILIPYLAADYACYAFQVAEYSKHFTCISTPSQSTSSPWPTSCGAGRSSLWRPSFWSRMP